jgi:ubiquinone/menaquinone biosynthesis C-methylase UbiE
VTDIWSAIGRQLKCPAGRAGLFAGRVMSIVNKAPNRLAIEALCIRPSDTVLELGFGPGDAVNAMAALATEGLVLGIDRSPEMAALASRRNRAELERGSVQLCLGRFEALPWRDGAADKILAVNVAYFFSADGREIVEARRVLKPGGLMAVYVTDKSTMAHWKFSGPDTHALYGEEELRALLVRGGFSAADVTIDRVELALGVRGLLAVARKPPA